MHRILCSLRMQFLESLETWKIEAMERANSVVAAKVLCQSDLNMNPRM